MLITFTIFAVKHLQPRGFALVLNIFDIISMVSKIIDNGNCRRFIKLNGSSTSVKSIQL